MGAWNCLSCAGKREISCTGIGIHWPKSNRKWELDKDFGKTATRTTKFVHLQ